MRKQTKEERDGRGDTIAREKHYRSENISELSKEGNKEQGVRRVQGREKTNSNNDAIDMK